jgi:5-histidylcysteine sulfoxide synthase/putative 4-mercaptohistidine N1-methyltranferase
MQMREVPFYDNRSLLNTRTVVLNEGDPEQKRREIRKSFHAAYDIDEALLQTLTYYETFSRRADPLRHPLIFYFGHTAVFYINKLIIAKLIDERINPSFESMFAVGVDEMSWDDLDMSHYDWPEVEEVQAYRHRVRERVDALIRDMPLTMPIDWNHPFWAILMGIEHSRIHLETSSVLIRQLPVDEVRGHPLWTPCRHSGDAPDNPLIDVAGGSVRMGKAFDHPLYGWDNEFGEHEAEIEPFRASRHLISNAEFLEFVEGGGYADDDVWTEEGRGWKAYERAAHPRFWIPDGPSYRLRTTWEEIDMPWDWPAEVNYLEAKAFCNWKSARTGAAIRLPTEEEWMLLRDRYVAEDQPWWDRAPGNMNLEHYASPCPVTEFAFGDFFDIVGNVWQWTETPIAGFRNFRPHPYYDDFSTPTFDGLHNLIKGGSWISTGNEATRDSRYAFRRHFYQHAGLRVVESERPPRVSVDFYETDEQICQYCEFHYGETHFGVPNYPKTCADLCLEIMADRPRRKALDLGCAVGRSTFELARGFDGVTGLDFSANFIRQGVEMKEKGYIQYTRKDEGELATYVERRLDEFGLEDAAERVEFFQADACNLIERYAGYDLVLAANLIDRLYSPGRFLASIGGRIVPGGLLVLLSPYTWLTGFTERREWIGAYRRDGEPFTTLEALRERLQDEFEPWGAPRDVPFVLRETARKFQHSIAQMTIWERKK